MTRSRLRFVVLVSLTALWAVSGCWPTSVRAQSTTDSGSQAARQTAPGAPAAPTGSVTVVDNQNAQEIRAQLETLLSRYPPAVGRVLKLDPTLLSNSTYLAPYPALAEFLGRHPEVARNPSFFLSSVRGLPGDPGPPANPQTEVIVMWRGLLQGISVFLVFLTVMATLAWLVRLLLDYRRWSRLAKVQADAHGKLLDRFTANDELLAYVQTPAGSRFLQSAPIALDPGHRALSAPFGRILWSIQAGLVLAAGGLGLQFVSGRILSEVAQPLFAMGVLALALGLGFVLSAVVAYALSRRLGLFEPAAAGAASARREGADNVS